MDVAEQRTRLGAVDEHFGELAADGRERLELHVTGDAAHAGAAQLVETGVADEAEQPGTGIDRNDATAQGGVRAQVDVLQHIVGVVAAAAQHPRRLPAQHGAMTLELGGERVLVGGQGILLGSWDGRVVDSVDARPRMYVSPFLIGFFERV